MPHPFRTAVNSSRSPPISAAVSFCEEVTLIAEYSIIADGNRVGGHARRRMVCNEGIDPWRTLRIVSESLAVRFAFARAGENLKPQRSRRLRRDAESIT